MTKEYYIEMMFPNEEFSRLKLSGKEAVTRIKEDVSNGKLKWLSVDDVFLNFDSGIAFKIIETDCEKYKKREVMNNWFTNTNSI